MELKVQRYLQNLSATKKSNKYSEVIESESVLTELLNNEIK